MVDVSDIDGYKFEIGQVTYFLYYGDICSFRIMDRKKDEKELSHYYNHYFGWLSEDSFSATEEELLPYLEK